MRQATVTRVRSLLSKPLSVFKIITDRFEVIMNSHRDAKYALKPASSYDRTNHAVGGIKTLSYCEARWLKCNGVAK
jgi:hypothetical protein